MFIKVPRQLYAITQLYIRLQHFAKVTLCHSFIHSFGSFGLFKYKMKKGMVKKKVCIGSLFKTHLSCFQYNSCFELDKMTFSNTRVQQDCALSQSDVATAKA